MIGAPNESPWLHDRFEAFDRLLGLSRRGCELRGVPTQALMQLAALIGSTEDPTAVQLLMQVFWLLVGETAQLGVGALPETERPAAQAIVDAWGLQRRELTFPARIRLQPTPPKEHPLSLETEMVLEWAERVEKRYGAIGLEIGGRPTTLTALRAQFDKRNWLPLLEVHALVHLYLVLIDTKGSPVKREIGPLFFAGTDPHS